MQGTNFTTDALLALTALAEGAEHVTVYTFWGNHYLVATNADGTAHTFLGRVALDGTGATAGDLFNLSDGNDGRFVPTLADLGIRG